MQLEKNSLYTKSFTILIIGQIISLFGSAIQRFALSLYILELTGSATIFSSILAVSIVPVIVLAPFAGILADRFNKRNVMVVLDCVSTVIMLIYAIVLFSGKDNVYIVAAMMLLLSATSTLYQPSVTTSIPLLVKEENLIHANGIVQQVSSLSNFLGPIIAGIIYGFIGIKGTILINLISFLCAAIMECFMEISYTKPEKMASPLKAFSTEIKESYYYLKDENRIVFRMCITSGLYNLFLVPLFSVGAPYIIKMYLGQSSQAYGFAEGAIAFGMILGAMIVGKWPHRFKISRVYRELYAAPICMALMAVALFYYNGSSGMAFTVFILFTLFAMGIMLVIGLANVVSAAYLQKTTPNNMLGKTTAFGTAFATICVPFGQMLFGWMLDLMLDRIYIMVLFSAVSTFLVTLIVRYNVRQINE